MDGMFTSVETSLPRHARNHVDGPCDSRTRPDFGAFHDHHNVPIDSASPASTVDPAVVPEACALIPVSCMRFAKSSFGTGHTRGCVNLIPPEIKAGEMCTAART